MNEFSKTKIAYSLALLAALFALHPLTEKLSFNFSIFSLQISIEFIYWVFVGLLAFTVYFYAISLIKEDKLYNKFHIIGNFSYTLSLLFPPVIFFLIGISALTALLPSNFWKVFLESLFSTVLGLLMSMGISKIMKKMSVKEKLLSNIKAKNADFELLERAKKLSKDKMYDLTIIDLWNVVETSFYRMFEENGIVFDKKKPTSIINVIKEKTTLPSMLIKELVLLRDMRNKSAHGVAGDIAEEQINELFNTVEKVLIYIHEEESCYYCGNKFPKFELEEEELIGDYYACKKCAHEHPDWQDEIIAMGMDS